MNKISHTKLINFPFNQNGAEQIRNTIDKGQNWPIVYILNGVNQAYVGETNNAYRRMCQHLSNSKRKIMKDILLLVNDSFNKSATLDIENKLIQYMNADGKYQLQNINPGQSVLHNYYQRGMYEECFEQIRNDLQKQNLANKNLYEIKNSEIFKYSPYKELTEGQFDCFEKLLKELKNALEKSIEKKIVVEGGAGTGKTVLAIYFIKTLIDTINRNTNFDDLDEDFNSESNILNSYSFINLLKNKKDLRIGFLVPTPSFRATVKKIFSKTKGLKSSMVISPNDLGENEYDILIVDEAHRLQRKKNLVNNLAYNNTAKKLGLSEESTQLDWITSKNRLMTILFYDPKQRVRISDMDEEDFYSFFKQAQSIKLTSQIRILGGNEYIDFINGVLKNNDYYYKLNEYDFKIFDDYGEMEKAILEKNKKLSGLSRIISGFAYPYSRKIRDKDESSKNDVDVDGDGKYLRKRNLDFNATDFITDDKHKNEIGCIYTCQGYDLNYAGVILGPDIYYDTNRKVIDIKVDNCYDKKAKNSRSLFESKEYILHAYLVLLTRGIYGTYIYAVDKNLRDYLKEHIVSKSD